MSLGVVSVIVVALVGWGTDMVTAETYDLVPVPQWSTGPDTFDSALESCTNRGGYIPLADKDTEMIKLAELAENLGHTEMWVNAKETLYPWEWISESRAFVETDQGCYLEEAIASFTSGREIRDLTKDECVTECKLRGFPLAAVQTLEPGKPDIGLCRCGDTLGPTGASNIQWCDIKCPGDPESAGSTIQAPGWCGEQDPNDSSLKYYRVLHVGAQGDLTWEVAAVTDNDLCGGFVFQEFVNPVTNQVARTYSLRKLSCAHSYNFICFLEDVTSTLCNLHLPNGGCYHISSGSTLRSSKSWYDARENCLISGGDLAYIDQAAGEYLQSEGVIRDNLPYWVGLTASHWRWNNSATEPTFKQTAWSPGQPDSATQNCLLLNTNRTWTDESCSARYYYFCILYERRLRTTGIPITRPTTTPTSTTPTTTTTPTPSTPVATEVTTAGGAVGAEGSPGLSTGAIVGIVVGLLLGIVAIVAVVFVGLFILKRRDEADAAPKRDETEVPPTSETTGEAGLTKNDERDGYINPAFSNPNLSASKEDIGPDGTPEVTSRNL